MDVVVVAAVSYHVVLDVLLVLDLEVLVLLVLDVEPRVLLDVADVCLFSLLFAVDVLLVSIAAATAAD